MKTLHLTNCWHSASRGISTFYRELLRQSELERRPIRLIVPGSSEGSEAHGNYGRLSRLSPGYRLIMPSSYLLPGSRVRQILAAERPDVIECCDKYTLNYLAALLRLRALGIAGYRPAVIGRTCERMDENMARYVSTSSWAHRFSRWYMGTLYFPLFDHHKANSLHTAAELQQASFGHRRRRGVWIRSMGADCRLFHPTRRSVSFRAWLQARSGAPRRTMLLLYVGRLALLEHHHSCEFRLVIAGDGPLRTSVEWMCERELPGAVGFLGYVSDRETLANIYANCDVFLHPNPREPFGIAPLEAMASGLPVICPNTGGLTSFAHAGNAMLAEPEPERTDSDFSNRNAIFRI